MCRCMVEKLDELILLITKYLKVPVATFHFMVTNIVVISVKSDDDLYAN